jgi:hypothetical protein
MSQLRGSGFRSRWSVTGVKRRSTCAACPGRGGWVPGCCDGGGEGGETPPAAGPVPSCRGCAMAAAAARAITAAAPSQALFRSHLDIRFFSRFSTEPKP